jgi:hypothetical protein
MIPRDAPRYGVHAFKFPKTPIKNYDKHKGNEHRGSGVQRVGGSHLLKEGTTRFAEGTTDDFDGSLALGTTLSIERNKRGFFAGIEK